jgi:heat shock protein HslJ
MAASSPHEGLVSFARTVLAALLLATGCVSPSTTAPVAVVLPPLEGTSWRAEAIDGAPVLDGVSSTLAFDANRKVAGRAACNRYFGSFEQAGESLAIKPAGLTRMACPPAVMEQERKFLAALEMVRRGRREDGGLVLLDGNDRARLRLSAILRQQAATMGLAPGPR